MKNNIQKTSFHLTVVLIAFSLFAQSCRKDKTPIPSEIETVIPDPQRPDETAPIGFYLLNEGNMNTNMASLDYMNFVNGQYHRNIYEEINPEITKGLGDVGNDMGIYGSKLYVVVNNSNKVEVLNAKTGKRIKQIDILSGRYIVFNKGKAYVSAYWGELGNPNAPNGIVAEIDTASLTITRQVGVGRQPEELAIVDNKLYVANSGGYSPQNYESTVSVIDLNTFQEINRIDVAINLHRLKADKEGDLYVSSRGDYYETPSRTYVIDTKTQTVKKVFDMPASQFVIQDDIAYVYSSEWSYITGGYTTTYHLIDTKTETVLDRTIITDGTKIETPYGIAVNPFTKEVYITDAIDNMGPGKLYCFSPEGKLKWSASTGNIPVALAFVY